MNRWDGTPLSGWPSVLQSIAVILTTPLGSRVMRRDFGSELPFLIGRPMVSEVQLAVFAATAQALARWEPRFRLTGVQVLEATPRGTFGLLLRGEYDGEAVEGTVAF